MSSTTPETVVGTGKPRPRCADIVAGGIRSAGQFAGLMSTLISDVIEGHISPGVCNAAVNAGGKLLKVVELQQRYGTIKDGRKELMLVPAEVDPEPEVIATTESK